MLCAYGCGNTATHTLKNGKSCCTSSANGCPVNKNKNSQALKKSIKEHPIDYKERYKERYKKCSAESKAKMLWNKGKHPETNFTYGGGGQHKIALTKERGHACEVCKLSEWNGVPITLELEHTDGDTKNNTRENLRLMCPNCHSQTPTWRRRKTSGNGKNHTDEQIIEVIKTSTSMSSALQKLGLRWGSYTTVLNIMKKYNIELTVWGS